MKPNLFRPVVSLASVGARRQATGLIAEARADVNSGRYWPEALAPMIDTQGPPTPFYRR